jgi:hypothetical protein
LAALRGLNCWRGHRDLRARNTQTGICIAQRSRRSQRGEMRVGDETASVDTTACGREPGKASHRGHRGRGEGNEGWVAKLRLSRGSLSVWRCAESSLGFTRPRAAASPLTSFAPSQFSPSVTSVASVRCFPPRRMLLARAASPLTSFAPSQFPPLCDLRGLCAMLSPKTCVSRPPTS